jgi:hypothetical protein
MRIRRIIVTALGAGLLVFGGTAYGQSGTCTPITTVPTTITTSGVYCLTGHLLYTLTTGTAITVDVNGVVIDFNGYRLLSSFGPAYPVTAVEVTAEKNVTIRNGAISEFNIGVNSAARSTIVEDMRLFDGVFGIQTNAGGSVIRRNYFHQTFSSILVYGPNSRVVDNDIVGETGNNAGNGILIYAQNAFVVGNRLSHLSNGIHFLFSGAGKYRDNLTTDVGSPYIAGTDVGNNF